MVHLQEVDIILRDSILRAMVHRQATVILLREPTARSQRSRSFPASRDIFAHRCAVVLAGARVCDWCLLTASAPAYRCSNTMPTATRCSPCPHGFGLLAPESTDVNVWPISSHDSTQAQVYRGFSRVCDPARSRWKISGVGSSDVLSRTLHPLSLYRSVPPEPALHPFTRGARMQVPYPGYAAQPAAPPAAPAAPVEIPPGTLVLFPPARPTNIWSRKRCSQSKVN